MIVPVSLRINWIILPSLLPRKSSKLQLNRTRTKTDTGSRGEYPQALE
jgi:hypothetical protein